MTDKTGTTAREYADAFETATRSDGTTFVRTKQDSPRWVQDLTREAHGDFLPDDWRYEHLAPLADRIAEAIEDDRDLDEIGYEIIDGLVDIYTSDLTAWLASHTSRIGYCDEAARDFGDDRDTVQRLMAGQYAELEEMFGALRAALETV